MSFFDQIKDKLFNQNPQGLLKPFKEPLQRNKREFQAFDKWKSSEKSKKFIRDISQAYFYKKTNIASTIKIHIFQAPGANGFAVLFNKSFEKNVFRFAIDLFKDKIAGMDYILQISEKSMIDRGRYVETKEKYYLKPSILKDAIELKKINQQFGNILLEHILFDNESTYLKVLVTHYQDHLFHQVQDFDQLIEYLFDQSQ